MKKSVVYIGRRMVRDKSFQVFTQNGKEHWFRSIRGVWIGHHYFMNVEKGQFLMNRHPERDETKEATQSQISKWEAQDLIVEHRLAERRSKDKANKEVKSKSEVRKIIAQLSEICEGMNILDKMRFVEAVSQMVISRSRK